MPSLQGRGYSSQKMVSIGVEIRWKRTWGWLYNITIYRKLFPPQLVSPDLEPLKKIWPYVRKFITVTPLLVALALCWSCSCCIHGQYSWLLASMHWLWALFEGWQPSHHHCVWLTIMGPMLLMAVIQYAGIWVQWWEEERRMMKTNSNQSHCSFSWRMPYATHFLPPLLSCLVLFPLSSDENEPQSIVGCFVMHQLGLPFSAPPPLVFFPTPHSSVENNSQPTSLRRGEGQKAGMLRWWWWMMNHHCHCHHSGPPSSPPYTTPPSSDDGPPTYLWKEGQSHLHPHFWGSWGIVGWAHIPQQH